MFLTNGSNAKSASQRYAPTIAQAMITTIVPCITWARFGHSTFFSSAVDSPMNRLVPPPGTRREPVCGLTACAAGRTCC